MHATEPLPEAARQCLQRLQALCPMRFQQFQFGSLPLKIWTACDIDPLLNALVEKEETHPDIVDERMPYWAELWPSSILMAETMIKELGHLPQGHWLELGCGPGLPGVLAACLGYHGVCSDYMQEALTLTRLNAYQNHCEDKIRVLELDWREPSFSEKFSWIIAGDVAYEKRNFQPLANTFAKLLQPKGEVWLGEPGRGVAKSFFELLEAEDWQITCINHQQDIRIYRIRRTD